MIFNIPEARRRPCFHAESGRGPHFAQKTRAPENVPMTGTMKPWKISKGSLSRSKTQNCHPQKDTCRTSRSRAPLFPHRVAASFGALADRSQCLHIPSEVALRATAAFLGYGEVSTVDCRAQVEGGGRPNGQRYRATLPLPFVGPFAPKSVRAT